MKSRTAFRCAKGGRWCRPRHVLTAPVQPRSDGPRGGGIVRGASRRCRCRVPAMVMRSRRRHIPVRASCACRAHHRGRTPLGLIRLPEIGGRCSGPNANAKSSGPSMVPAGHIRTRDLPLPGANPLELPGDASQRHTTADTPPPDVAFASGGGDPATAGRSGRLPFAARIGVHGPAAGGDAVSVRACRGGGDAGKRPATPSRPVLGMGVCARQRAFPFRNPLGPIRRAAGHRTRHPVRSGLRHPRAAGTESPAAIPRYRNRGPWSGGSNPRARPWPPRGACPRPRAAAPSPFRAFD